MQNVMIALLGVSGLIAPLAFVLAIFGVVNADDAMAVMELTGFFAPLAFVPFAMWATK